jgi:hypothetical protein
MYVVLLFSSRDMFLTYDCISLLQRTYLALIAKTVYFLESADPLTMQVKTIKKRVWLRYNNPSHCLLV